MSLALRSSDLPYRRSAAAVLVLLPAVLAAGASTASAEAPDLPAGVSEAWWSGARAGILQSEYHVRPGPTLAGGEQTWQAANRAQRFRMTYSRRGVKVVPSARSRETWEWSLRLIDLNVETLNDADLAWADYAFISAMVVQRKSAQQTIARCKEAGL